MKLSKKRKSSMGALLLICLLLLGQAACALTLPHLLSDIVGNGFRRGGMEEGVPEAMSLQGMTLLQCFMTEEDREQIAETYLTFEPESSEAQRLSARYPYAREESICALREGLPEDRLTAANTVYERACVALLRYLRQNEKTGELEEISQKFSDAQKQQKEVGKFGDNLRDLTGQESSLPEGVLGSMPEGALFTLPEPAAPESSNSEGSSSGEASAADDGVVMRDSQQKTFGEDKTESTPAGSAPESGAETDGSPTEEKQDFTLEDLTRTDTEVLYSLLPLLARVPKDSISEMITAAEAAPAIEKNQAGGALKRLLYREVGIDVEKIQSDYVLHGSLLLLGVALLGLAAAAGAVLLAVKQRVSPGFCTLCTSPVLLVGGTVLALVQPVSVAGRIVFALILLLGLLMPAYKRLSALQKLSGRWEKPFAQAAGLVSQSSALSWLFPFTVTFLTWVMVLLCALVLALGGAAGETGAAMACTLYAVQAISALGQMGVLWAGQERKITFSGSAGTY